MAKYNSIPPFTGTYGPICIYKMYGNYYLRSRSSLTGKRVKNDPAFQKTLQFAALLSKASRIGSVVYAIVPAYRKQHALYRKLTGEAMTWLKYQWKEEDIIGYLTNIYAGQQPLPKKWPATKLKGPNKRPKQGLTKRINRSLETPSKQVPFSLLLWRSRDRLYRRRYNQSINSYSWAEYVMT